MKKILSVALCLAAPLFAACGGPGTFDGKVGGNALTVKSSALIDVSLDADGVTSRELVVILSDQDKICDLLKARKGIKNSKQVSLTMATTDADGVPSSAPAKGKFNVVGLAETLPKSSNIAASTFQVSDDQCLAQSEGALSFATTGSITLDDVSVQSGGAAHGSFDLTYEGKDHVTGTFDAEFCDVDLTTLTGDSTCG